MTNQFQAVLFDLDGTLADTLDAIAKAGNSALNKLDRPEISRHRYRNLVGQGVHWLMTQALSNNDQQLVPQAVELFLEYYGEHGDAQTRPYDGVINLLNELNRRRLIQAVLSNKPHDATRSCVSSLFAGYSFDHVAGAKPDVPLKPEPDAAIDIANRLGVVPHRWLFLGDTNIDMLTANSAGMYPVGALWGFRDAAELRDSGAKTLIDHPMQLLDVLDRRT